MRSQAVVSVLECTCLPGLTISKSLLAGFAKMGLVYKNTAF